MKRQRRPIEQAGLTISPRYTQQAIIKEMVPAGAAYFFLRVEARGKVAYHTRALIESLEDSEWDRQSQGWIIPTARLDRLAAWLPLAQKQQAILAVQDAAKARRSRLQTVAVWLSSLMPIGKRKAG